MITAQDIREKTFGRKLGGYDMYSVDVFLEELAGDVAAYQEEIDTLRGEIESLKGKINDTRTKQPR